MKCRVRCQILFGLVALLQFGYVSGKLRENDHALMLQTKVENLIEKILQVIEDYYHQIRTELKCIPDEVPDTIIGTLKNAIDCVDQNERNYDSGRITGNVHKKAFLKCFSDAKAEVEETITSIDPTLSYCPENMTEKTYQINVTTTITKTFHINIKNGLEIMKKKVHLGNEEDICVFNQGEQHPGKPNQTAHDNAPENDISDEDNSGADENKIKDIPFKGHHGKGHESKGHHGKGHESVGHHGKEHESMGHHGKGHEFSGRPHNGYESKDYHILGEENENFTGISDYLASAHGQNDSSNADKNNVYQSVEQVSDDNDHASKEHHSKDHESKEHHGTGSEPKDDHGKGHESKEDRDKGHESKVRPNEGHESKEILTQGHVSKEHHGKEQQSNESVLGMNDSGDEYGGNDSSNEDGVSHEPGQEIDDDNDNGENDSDLDNYFPSKELPGHGGASNDDDDDHDEDDNENEFSDADEYDEESDSSGTDEDEDGGVNRPDSAQENDEESEAEGHHIARPDSKEFHGKGHDSKESYDKNPSSAQQPEDYEESQGSDDDNSYEDYDADDADDDADDDEDINFLQEGKQNTVNSIADHAAHDIEIQNKTKNKNPFSGHGPITDDGGPSSVLGTVLGTGHEKIFLPDTTAKSKFTTLPASKLALGSPTKKPFDQNYYADPDTEPEDSNYGNEYYDASENPEKSLNQKLGRPKPAAPVAQRIQIKPKNQIKQKPKKPRQNTERHKITLPKNWPKKEQQRLPSHSIISLSQSLPQSDI